jgi:hypothetical protein
MDVSVVFFPFFILAILGAVALTGDWTGDPTCFKEAKEALAVGGGLEGGAAEAIAVGVGLEGGAAEAIAVGVGLDGGAAVVAFAAGLGNSVAETAAADAGTEEGVLAVPCSKGVWAAFSVFTTPEMLVPPVEGAAGADGRVPSARPAIALSLFLGFVGAMVLDDICK